VFCAAYEGQFLCRVRLHLYVLSLGYFGKVVSTNARERLKKLVSEMTVLC